jgi:hypothetical protein
VFSRRFLILPFKRLWKLVCTERWEVKPGACTIGQIALTTGSGNPMNKAPAGEQMTRAKGTGSQPRKGDKKFAPKKPRSFVLKNPRFAPDSEKSLTLQQERFVLEYLSDFNTLRALRAAGYTFKTDADGRSRASYLLSLPHIAVVVAKKKAEIAEKLGLDAVNCLKYFRLVFLEALTDRDFTNANRSLENVAKILGLYEKNNVQRRPERLSPEELARLKAELEMRGFDFTRRNFPAHLVGVRPDHRPRTLSTDASNEHDEPADLARPQQPATPPTDRPLPGADTPNPFGTR